MNKKIILVIVGTLLVMLGMISGYEVGYKNGFKNGYYHGFDKGEIWDSGYSDGFVSGYEESIIWYPVFSKDIYIRHYNNSVRNWTNGISAEDSFNELTKKYYERRK